MMAGDEASMLIAIVAVIVAYLIWRTHP